MSAKGRPERELLPPGGKARSAKGAPAIAAALALVDVQQDFLARPGIVPAVPQLLGRLVALVHGCRGAGLPVLHVRTLIDADGGNRMPHWKRAGRWECVAGTRGAEPPAGLEALSSEPVLGKPYYSAFGHPGFDRALRAAGVDTAIVAGIFTHACVRATALDAYQHGYAVWLAADAVASYDPAHAAMTLRHLDGRACEAVAVTEILDRLQRGRSSAM